MKNFSRLFFGVFSLVITMIIVTPLIKELSEYFPVFFKEYSLEMLGICISFYFSVIFTIILLEVWDFFETKIRKFSS